MGLFSCELRKESITTAPGRSQQVVLDEYLLAYLLGGSEPLPEPLADALDLADELGLASMQISPDQAVLLRFLLRMIKARRVLEIGTFIGLSALVIADAVGPDGSVVCLDVSEEWTDHARRLWRQAGVGDRIDLRVGDAHTTVRNLTDTFDAVLIDADKSGYADYLEAVTPRLRVGGLLVIDNTLWSGRVVDEADVSPDTRALRQFNISLARHPDYEVAMVGIGDGFTLARRR